MKIIRVLFVQTWRPAPDEPPDGTVLEEYRCDTAEEAERLLERLSEKYWDALGKTCIQVHDVES
jgi:hypothetical protein